MNKANTTDLLLSFSPKTTEKMFGSVLLLDKKKFRLGNLGTFYCVERKYPVILPDDLMVKVLADVNSRDESNFRVNKKLPTRSDRDTKGQSDCKAIVLHASQCTCREGVGSGLLLFFLFLDPRTHLRIFMVCLWWSAWRSVEPKLMWHANFLLQCFYCAFCLWAQQLCVVSLFYQPATT